MCNIAATYQGETRPSESPQAAVGGGALRLGQTFKVAALRNCTFGKLSLWKIPLGIIPLWENVWEST